MIRILIDVYIFLIIADAIISYLPQIHHYQFVKMLKVATEFSQAPIRKHLPQGLPIDASPIVVIMILKIFAALW